jgi:hypothetical protein
MTLADILKAAITKSGKESGRPSTEFDIKHGYFVDDAGDNVGSMSITASHDLRELVETAVMLVVSGVEPCPASLTHDVGGGKVVICITWTEESPLAKAQSMWKQQMQVQADALIAQTLAEEDVRMARVRADAEYARILSAQLNGRVGAGAVVRGGLGRGAVVHGGSGRGAVVRGGSGRGGGNHDALSDAEFDRFIKLINGSSSAMTIEELRKMPL